MTGVLDDPAAIGRYDTGQMLAAVMRLPEQLREGWALAREVRLPDGHARTRNVAILGMGGSAIAGDIVRSVYADRLRAPIVSVRDYDLPAFVGPETLVVAVSHSGATEETVSALSHALERRCPVVVVATGGPMAEVARRAGLPLLSYAASGQPRAAIGYGISVLTSLLESAGHLEVDAAEVSEAADVVSSVLRSAGPEFPTERNPAKQLAWVLVDRFILIQASGHLAAAARRWKTQLNENAKQIAAVEELPEATHNAVVGYAQPESLHDHLFVVFLASIGDHPRNRLRAALSAELLGASGIGHQVVPVPGESRLAQTCAAIAHGDLVSCYLAILYGLDPTPVDAIGLIRQRLAGVDASAED
jgi:glucose/mannose-6-phosphate isomerase